jgi:uncharacterized lipoprotein YmbA
MKLTLPTTATGTAVILVALALLAMIGPGCTQTKRMGSQEIPANLDIAAMRVSDQGQFRASYTSAVDPVKINEIHSWTLHVETLDGRPTSNAEITVDGDMPGHGHGLPTRPQVTRELGNGDYLVEGLRFSMPGWWVINFHIKAGDQQDRVTFNLLLR